VSASASARIGPVRSIPRPLAPKAPSFGDQQIDSKFRSPFSSPEFPPLGSDGYQVALVSIENHGAIPGSGLHSASVPHLLLLPITWQDLLKHLRSESARPRLEGSSEVAKFGEVWIDFLRHEARRAEEPIELTPLEFKVLKFFNSNPYRVISRGELLDKVWGYDCYPSTRTVDNHILSLRRKLEREPATPIHFQTIHGVGYKFVPC